MARENYEFTQEEWQEISFAIGTIVGCVDLMMMGITQLAPEVNEQFYEAVKIVDKFNFTPQELQVFFEEAYKAKTLH